MVDRTVSGRLSVCVAACLLTLLLGACSNEEVEGLKKPASQKVAFSVTGVGGEVLDNVSAQLASLPEIPAPRAPVYAREIEDRVRLALRSYGYYHPGVALTFPRPGDESPVLGVAVDPGKPLFIRNCNVEIIGEGAFYGSFRKIIDESGLSSYSRLSHGRYEALKTALRDKALELGFFDAELIISRIMVYGEQNAADIEVLYDTGRRYAFGAVVPENAATAALLEPAAGLVPFSPGDPFESGLIGDYSQALSQTQYYRSVDVRAKVEDLGDYRVPVAISLERQKENLMRVGLGYSTDEDIRVMLGWDKPLLNRYGHSFSFFARVSSVKQDAQIVYKIPRKNPNLDYYYVRLAQTYTDYNDTLSDLSHASVHYVANMTGRWRRDYSLRLEYEDYTQGDEKGNSYNLMPGLLLTRQSSSGGFDPLVGYNFSIDASFGTAAVTDCNFARVVATLKGIFSPSDSTRFFYRFRQGWIMGEDSTRVPPSLRFFIGGDQSVRGFSYLIHSAKKDGKLTGARYLSAATAELQFPIGLANSRGAVFFDAGTACNDYGGAEWIFGPGIGYRFVSPYGTARVDLAMGIDNHSDNTSFKLHFSFGPEF